MSNRADADVYEQETEGRLEPFLEREWLLTNGIGGYATGTAVGINTRRYHGLLVAATLPPVGRDVTLSRFVELLLIDGRRVDFSAGIFGQQVIGDGVRHLRRFQLGGEVARWEFDVEGTRIQKELLVCWQVNAAGIRYRIRRGRRHAGSRISLNLLPLFALRDFHGLRRREAQPGPGIAASEERAVVVQAGDLGVRVEADAGCFRQEPDWWLGQTYPQETARGMDDVEDLFTPGVFEFNCEEGEEETRITLWAHLAADEGGFIWEQERDRRRQQIVAPRLGSPIQQKLARSAADFVVQRHRPDGGPGTTIIAGYPWFGDWGRDTFISLPGLLLVTRRHAEAGQVLATFADHVSQGMIPNRFNDYTNEPEYNTVDASLWFIHGAHEYVRATGDTGLYERLLAPACREIVAGYTRGTRYGIQVDPADGLVGAGDETTQLTWMDAKRDGVVFTPRHGKAVEINALWYSALMLLGERERAEQVRRSFVQTFWAGEDHGLIDVVNPTEASRSIRPNQIFAVSLPHSPLDGAQQRAVVEVVRRRLLTPYGLRTLAPGDERYQAHFTGPIFERDRAYHNGSVWPWLIGPFLDAYLKVNQRSPESMKQARKWLSPLLEHLEHDACLGSISEVFDAEEPYRSAGCCAQAWSIAEVLRLAVELEI